MPEDMGTIRAACRAELPGRIKAALDEYRRFVAEPPPDDSKGFAAWQAAAKAALSHVEGLVKLARWAEGEASEEPGGLDSLLAQARDALACLDEDDL
ncbi:MAG: hypothetical protein HYU59_08485 [Magnetospirillum gryphiswaldense]|nr:hypothetical protein [Magnetospirillum gryphiswaldense]